MSTRYYWGTTRDGDIEAVLRGEDVEISVGFYMECIPLNLPVSAARELARWILENTKPEVIP